MVGGVFDPFSRIVSGPSDEGQFPSIHIGVVRSYISSTNSVMVLVPTINSGSEIGPCKVMKHYGATVLPPPAVPPVGVDYRFPQKGDKVIVALIDGSLNSAVVLGYL